MHFLKTLFWVLLAVVMVLFATRNWGDVTLNLWGDIQASIKIPLLLFLTFLLGLVPTWLIMRTRMWAMRRRLEVFERQAAMPPQAATPPPAPATIVNDGEPAI